MPHRGHAAQAAAEAQRITLPAPEVVRIDALLTGVDVDALGLSTFSLGMPRQQVARGAENDWGVKQTPFLELDEQHFAVTRNRMSQLLETERRGGGLLTARSYRGRAGQPRYREHYPGPVPVAELEAHLRERSGAPGERRVARDGFTSLPWEDGDRYLKVQAGRRIDQHRQLDGV